MVQSEAIAGRYARALLDIAVSQGGADARASIDAFARELERFREPFMASDELRVALSNPSIPMEQRHKVLEAIMARLSLSPMVANFLRLLIDRSRIMAFDAMVQAYHKLGDERAGRLRGKVTSAQPLDRAQHQRLEQTFSKMLDAEVHLDARVDADLLGGLRVDLGGKSYDGSVRGQLDQLGEQLRRTQTTAAT